MAHESEHSKVQAEAARARRPRFWVGPLLVGCCFSLGYGITHRVVTLQANPEPPASRTLFAKSFGQSLASLRRSSGGTGSLDVDVAPSKPRQRRSVRPKQGRRAGPPSGGAPVRRSWHYGRRCRTPVGRPRNGRNLVAFPGGVAVSACRLDRPTGGSIG